MLLLRQSTEWEKTLHTWFSCRFGFLFKQKWRLASPSVTKLSFSRASDSVIRFAEIAARRICDCCFPSQPLGWLRTKWMFDSIELQDHISESTMYCLVDRNKYPKKSLSTWAGVLFFGNDLSFRSSNSWSGANCGGRRWSLNLYDKSINHAASFWLNKHPTAHHSTLITPSISASAEFASMSVSAPAATRVPLRS